jgi:hypothetical protein
LRGQVIANALARASVEGGEVDDGNTRTTKFSLHYTEEGIFVRPEAP